MEEPGGLQSMGSLRVGYDWATSLSCIGEGNGNPLQCSCLETPRDRGAWWTAVYGVEQGRTQLKRLSSSSSSVSMSTPIFQFTPCLTSVCNHVCFLHLWLYFCFVNSFICTMFLDSTYTQYHTIFVFLCLTYLLSMINFSSIHVTANSIIPTFSMTDTPLCICTISSLSILVPVFI